MADHNTRLALVLAGGCRVVYQRLIANSSLFALNACDIWHLSTL